jgi:hypothetical protein
MNPGFQGASSDTGSFAHDPGRTVVSLTILETRPADELRCVSMLLRGCSS